MKTKTTHIDFVSRVETEYEDRIERFTNAFERDPLDYEKQALLKMSYHCIDREYEVR